MPSDILSSVLLPSAPNSFVCAFSAAFAKLPDTSEKILEAGPETPIPAILGRSNSPEVGKSIPRILVVPIVTDGKVKLKPSPQSPTVNPTPRPPAKDWRKSKVKR